MAKKKTKHERERLIIQSIRLTWESLESHLDGCAEDSPPKHIRDKYGVGDQKFEKKCVKEYAVIIKNLADLF